MTKFTEHITGVDFTIGSESANVINVAAQLKAQNGNYGQRGAVTCYLSDDANGDSISAAPNAVAIGTDGVIIKAYAASESFVAVSESDGNIDIDITETAADTFYLVVVLPNGELVVSEAITFV